MSAIRIAVVIPVFNEDASTLAQSLTSAKDADEIIIVDGGSEQRMLETSQQLGSEYGARFVSAPQGRASQMNAGAKLAKADWLIFLHADVQLACDWRQQLIPHLGPGTIDQLPHWGRFDVRFRSVYESTAKCYAWLFGMNLVATFMNARSRITGISTGDQGQFIRRQSFVMMNGFPEQLLMEDVEFSKRAAKLFGKPLNLSAPVTVSARRWHQYGYFRTIALMWKLRWQYWRGATPVSLHQAYYGKS